MKGDREKSHRRRRVRLHHEAGRHRPAALADAGVAVPARASTVEAPEGRLRHSSELEIELLLEGVYRHYGFDFRAYAHASLMRRRCGSAWRPRGLRTISGCTTRLLHDPDVMERLLLDLSINVTAMFRDPTFYLAFREQVVPLLRTYPFMRIWHAGCSTGEEVYSLAILLEEEGLLRPRAHLRDRHQRGRARTRARPASSRSTGCRSTPRTTSAPAASARSPSTTRRSTTARCSSASLTRERRLRAAQPRHGPRRSTSSTSSSAATC